MNRYFSSFIATVLVYTALAATFLYSYTTPTMVSSQQKRSDQNVKFTVIAQKPEPKVQKKVQKKVVKKIEKKIVKKIEKKPEPKKITKKIVKKPTVKKIEKPKKIVKKPEPKKIIKPKKVVKKEPVKKKVEKKQIVKKQIVKKQEVQKKVAKKEPTPIIKKTQIKQNKTVSNSKSTLQDQNELKRKKNKYLTTIKETISKNKKYPKIAIRRSIQGDVKVKFTISPTGELLSFDIVEGKKVFKKSIKKAIEKSFPLKPPKDLFTANLDLSLTIQYKLF